MRIKLALLVLLTLNVSLLKAEKGTPQPSPNAIAPGLKIYIEPNDGFETYLRAAFQKKSVPLSIVVDKEKADLIMTSTVVSGKEPSAAAIIFTGKRNANQDASASIVNPKTGAVLFSYSVHKYSAVNGQQSAAESIAKNVKNKVESGK